MFVQPNAVFGRFFVPEMVSLLDYNKYLGHKFCTSCINHEVQKKSRNMQNLRQITIFVKKTNSRKKFQCSVKIAEFYSFFKMKIP